MILDYALESDTDGANKEHAMEINWVSHQH